MKSLQCNNETYGRACDAFEDVDEQFVRDRVRVVLPRGDGRVHRGVDPVEEVPQRAPLRGEREGEFGGEPLGAQVSRLQAESSQEDGDAAEDVEPEQRQLRLVGEGEGREGVDDVERGEQDVTAERGRGVAPLTQQGEDEAQAGLHAELHEAVGAGRRGAGPAPLRRRPRHRHAPARLARPALVPRPQRVQHPLHHRQAAVQDASETRVGPDGARQRRLAAQQRRLVVEQLRVPDRVLVEVAQRGGAQRESGGRQGDEFMAGGEASVQPSGGRPVGQTLALHARPRRVQVGLAPQLHTAHRTHPETHTPPHNTS